MSTFRPLFGELSGSLALTVVLVTLCLASSEKCRNANISVEYQRVALTALFA